jgi:mannose-6-phosphate isomerase-like protein (cupin superfamily)
MKSLRSRLAFAAALSFCATVAVAQAQYVSAERLRAGVAKTTAGLATFTVPTELKTPLLMVRREADGEVEQHDKLNDEFVSVRGRASIMIGGVAQGQRQSAPDEWRGGTLRGGKIYNLNAGDLIWIPAGVPHQMLVRKGASFEYLAFKYPRADER